MKTFRCVLWTMLFAPVVQWRPRMPPPPAWALLLKTPGSCPIPAKLFSGQRADKTRVIRRHYSHLRLLRPDFDCLITYSCKHGLEHVPAAAEKLGYQALIVGIWDPKSEMKSGTPSAW